MNILEIGCGESVHLEEIVGVLITYAHARGFAVEHDAVARRLMLRLGPAASAAVTAAPAEVATDAPSAKIVSFASERQRRGC